MTLSAISGVLTADQALGWLREQGSAAVRDAMAPKYGIRTPLAFGVPMKQMKALAKHLGTSHAMAHELWHSGWYEARSVASMVDDHTLVTPQQMDQWCEDFDNWAIVDTVCFNLFDRTAHAWQKVHEWSEADGEFQKRAAFALLWSLALHDKTASDGLFLDALVLVKRESGDDRKYVSKAISMALRAMAHRGPPLADHVRVTQEGLAAPHAR